MIMAEIDLCALQHQIDSTIDDLNAIGDYSVVLGFPMGSVVYLQSHGRISMDYIDDLDYVLFLREASSDCDSDNLKREFLLSLRRHQPLTANLSSQVIIYKDEDTYRLYLETVTRQYLRQLPQRKVHDKHWVTVTTFQHRKKFLKKFVETILLTKGNIDPSYIQCRDKLREATTSSAQAIEDLYDEVLSLPELGNFNPGSDKHYTSYETILQDFGCPPRRR
jgi:hypothetical protein